jgi:hypothetical protein
MPPIGPNDKTPREGSLRAVAKTPLLPRPTSKSGEHPAVVAMRDKLESITDGELVAANEIDLALAAYLEEVRTPVPPAR